MIYVVGSGPAGISAAASFVAAGIQVTLLDGGNRLERDTQGKLDALKNAPKESWDKAFLESWKNRVVSDTKGVQVKYAYGSDFPYSDVAELIPIEANNVGHLTPTLARGGFSSVWGSAVLPFRQEEIADWPIGIDALRPFYQTAFEQIPLSGTNDSLASFFPLYHDKAETLRSGSQAKKLFAQMEKNAPVLNAEGLYFGAPRLAVAGNSCVYCGMCLYGCPKGIIFNSEQTLTVLEREKNFTYLPGVVVEKLAESPAGVQIRVFHRAEKKSLTLSGEAVFLGAGVLSSAKILLQSFPEACGSPELKVSEYFLLPLLQREAVPNAHTEELHTLSQLFLECFDKNISKQSIHMQLYTYSDLYDHALSRMLRFAGPLAGSVKRRFLARLLAMQGYLHSDISSRIALSLKGETLVLTGRRNPLGEKTIRKLGWKLFGKRKQLGFTPILPQLHVGLPGEGRHAGGSFPMSEHPGPGQTNRNGCLFSTERVFIVDSSVFPSVPASTITLSVMANARRIAHAYIHRQTADASEQKMLHHGK